MVMDIVLLLGIQEHLEIKRFYLQFQQEVLLN